MAPIRRYLRISKFNVLECRIMLQNPELAESWLLHPQHPVLPRILESVRPLLKIKLQEEEQKSKLKGKKSKKATKDVIVEDDFECLVFLKHSLNRYDLLSKQKTFNSGHPHRHMSDALSTTDGSNQHPVDLANDNRSSPILLQEDSDEALLDSIPPLPAPVQPDETEPRLRGSSHKRGRPINDSGPSPQTNDSDDDDLLQQGPLQPKGPKQADYWAGIGLQEEEKKKLGMTTSYDGFSIYGLTLYLVITRTSGPTGTTANSSGSAGGQAMMKDWIASTQQAPQDV